MQYNATKRTEEAVNMANPLHHASEDDAFIDSKYIVFVCVCVVLLLVVLMVVIWLIIWRKTVINYIKGLLSQHSAPANHLFEPARNSIDSNSEEANHMYRRECIIDIPPEDFPRTEETDWGLVSEEERIENE